MNSMASTESVKVNSGAPTASIVARAATPSASEIELIRTRIPPSGSGRVASIGSSFVSAVVKQYDDS